MKAARRWSLALAMMLGGCAGQPLWKSEPASKPAATAPAAQAAETAAETQAEPEAKPPVAARPEAPPPPRYSPQVQAGITAYDDGNHTQAAKLLRAALKTRLDADDQVAAHKYLAFIECSANRRTQCRNEFRRALKIDPAFDLTPAEAGHPVWGPVFRALKQPSKPRR